MSHFNHQNVQRGLSWGGVVTISVVLSACVGGAEQGEGNGPETDGPADIYQQEPSVGMSPFSVTAVVGGTTVDEVVDALAEFIHRVDDTSRGLPADWVVAGGDQLEPSDPAHEAALHLPGGNQLIEVCNHHYASQAMGFGGHHGVALPCEIAVTQVGDEVEVVLLNPEAIFGVFFRDIPEEHASQMGGMAAAVRGELEGLIAAGLEGLDAEMIGEDVGPSWDEDFIEQVGSQSYSIELDMSIPEAFRGSDEDRADFQILFVDALLQTLTHEGMDEVGSRVEGLSVPDWRAARSHALGLPGGVKVVEMCSPTYAGAAMQTGQYHAPALPCEAAVWVDGDVLRVHLLDPTFIFPVFFGDAPAEMGESMAGMASAVAQDLQLIIESAQTSLR